MLKGPVGVKLVKIYYLKFPENKNIAKIFPTVATTYQQIRCNVPGRGWGHLGYGSVHESVCSKLLSPLGHLISSALGRFRPQAGTTKRILSKPHARPGQSPVV